MERGRWRVAQWSRRTANDLRPTGWRTVRTRHGYRMRVNRADWLGRAVWAVGDYETAVGQVMQATLGEGDTALDIGANQGFFTLLMAGCVGPTGSVHSFEPIPGTRQLLQTNIALNKLDQCHVHGAAVTDEAGELEIWPGPADHSGIASLRPSDQTPALRVPAWRLDDMTDLPKVRLMKIDVEGAEMRALRGAMDLIERCRPVIVLEVTDEFLGQLGDSAAALWAMFSDLRYRVWRVDHDGLAGLSGFTREQINAVALPAEQDMPQGLTVKPTPAPQQKAG